MNYFEILNRIDVNDKTEKKNGLTYLSWAFSWGELKKLYPLSYYTIYENDKGWFYHSDGITCWVKTGITVVTDDKEIEHIEYLPVMDFRNKSIPFDSVTSFDVNKAIQRSLTKAVARHGLGLYIYAGEDLPEQSVEGIPADKAPKPVVSAAPAKVSVKTTTKERIENLCETHKLSIKDFGLLLKVLQDEGKVANKTTAEMNSVEVDTMLREMDAIRGQTSVGAN